MNLQNQPIPPRPKKKKRRIWPWVLAVLAFLIAAAAGALFASSGLLDKPKDDVVEDGLLTARDKTTIMIMGVDERDDDVGRSDTLMVATIDPKKNQAALLSIPRDTRVKIKGNGWDKINAAYAYGGEKLTQRTVEDFLGVNMDHYIIINPKSFQKIIDAIGGIDIDVEKRMYYEDPWDDDGGLLIDLKPGMQHMDGKTAVTYVRFRDEEGDIGRIRRQQKFMKACMDKLVSPSIILKLPTVISEIMDSVKTDLNVRQLLEFAGSLKESQKNGLKTEMVPGRPLYIDGISYWIPDLKELRTALADTLGITLSASDRSRMDQQESEYKKSIPANAKEVPASDTSIGRAHTTSHLKQDRNAKSRDRDAKDTNTKKGGKDSKDAKGSNSSSDVPEKMRDMRHENDASNASDDTSGTPASTGPVPTRDSAGGKSR